MKKPTIIAGLCAGLAIGLIACGSPAKDAGKAESTKPEAKTEASKTAKASSGKTVAPAGKMVRPVKGTQMIRPNTMGKNMGTKKIARTGMGEGSAKSGAAPAKTKAKAMAIKPMPQKPAPKITFSGTIVDSAGNPVKGAKVSSYFNAYRGTPTAYDFGTSDADGNFTTDQRKSQGDTVLYVHDGGDMGAVVMVPQEGAKDLKITLVKQRTATFELTHWDPKVMAKTAKLEAEAKAAAARKAAGEPAPAPKKDANGRIIRAERPWGGSVVVFAVDDEGKRRNPRFLYTGAQFGHSKISLPPGTYDFWILGNGCKNDVVRRTIEAGEGVQKLPDMQLSKTIINEHMNKTAPAITPTHVRKLGKEIPAGTGLALDDYKGKWVVLEFWGFW